MALNSNNSRTLSAGKNALTAFANKILILILTFISRRFFIQYIGVEYLGINGLFANILTLLSMADLGLGTAMNVSLYQPIAQNDTNKIDALINYFKRIYSFIAIAVTVVGFALLPFLRLLINMEQDIPYIEVYYAVYVLKNTVSYLLVYKSALLYADQKNYIINLVDSITNSAKVVIQTIVIVLFKNYLLFIIVDVVSVLAKNIIVSIRATREYPFLSGNHKLDTIEKKALFSDISSVFIYKVAFALLNGTDNILMSVIVGTIWVGLYSNYYTITSAVELFIGLLFTSLTASVGNLVAKESFEKRFQVFEIMQLVSFWICGFTVVSLYYLLQDFITLWLGSKMLLDNLTLIAIVINLFFSTCMRPVWTFREGTGMYKQIRYIMLITAGLNLILSIVLGKILGVSGILFATSISKLLTYFWYEPNILFKNFFKKNPMYYYLDYIKNGLVVGICIAICYFPLKLISQVSIVSFLLKALIITVIVNLIFLLFYYRTEPFKTLLQRIRYVKK